MNIKELNKSNVPIVRLDKSKFEVRFLFTLDFYILHSTF